MSAYYPPRKDPFDALEIMGPYSEWPRRQKRDWKKIAVFSGSAAGAAVFAHCVGPLMF